MSYQREKLPILSKNSIFGEWQLDAKQHLRKKKLFKYCAPQTGTSTTNAAGATTTVYPTEDEDEREEAIGVLWEMLDKDAKGVVKGHVDDPRLMWQALETKFAPKQAGTRYNGYLALLGIRLGEDESLLSYVGRVEDAMRVLKGARPDGYDLAKADDELHSIALLQGLPADDADYKILKAPFIQQADPLDPEKIGTALSNHRAMNTQLTEAGSADVNPMSSVALATSTVRKGGSSSSKPPATTGNTILRQPGGRAVPTAPCNFCGYTGHWMSDCMALKRQPLPQVQQQRAATATASTGSGQGSGKKAIESADNTRGPLPT